MSEILKFQRRTENGYDGEKLKIEKTGTNSFRITTGGAGEFDFRNRIKAQRFDAEFISQLNRFLPQETQLRLQDREVYDGLNELRRKLETDAKYFDFRI
jgi:hypothetical protein